MRERANEPRIRINDGITVPQVRLISETGEQLGIKPIRFAQDYAADKNLDLVEVAPNADPPVCRVMNYSKYRYELELKAKQARKHQSQIVIKEIKFRPKVGQHDYETKKGHVVRFLKAGDKVKITIMFRGREQHRPELGFRLLQRLAEDVAELGFVESAPKQDGRNMIMVLGPHRKKADVMAEQRAERSRRTAADGAVEPAEPDAAETEPTSQTAEA